MSEESGQLSNPFSTGGGGVQFETRVQASFVVLMLAGGYVPCLPGRSISKVKLQGKSAGYATDDLIVFTDELDGEGNRKLLGQVKHFIGITKKNKVFAEVIHAAWQDFSNPTLFNRGRDAIALVTGPLTSKDTADVRTILEWARSSEDHVDYFNRVELAKFSSVTKQKKLEVFRYCLKKANRGTEVPDEIIFQFLRHFHLVGFDLDIKAGVTLALLHSLIGQNSSENVQSIWARLIDEVQHANQNAGTLSPASLPEELVLAFQRKEAKSIPKAYLGTAAPSVTGKDLEAAHLIALAAAAIAGGWSDDVVGDSEILKRLVDGL